MPQTRKFRSNSNAEKETSGETTTGKRGRPRAILGASRTREKCQGRETRSSRKDEPRVEEDAIDDGQPPVPKRADKMDDGSQIVAAIAGLEAKLARRIDAFAGDLGDRIETLERGKSGSTRSRSASRNGRANSTPARSKMAAESGCDVTASRRRSRSAHDDVTARAGEARYCGEDDGARNRESLPVISHSACATRGGYERTFKSPFDDVMSPTNVGDSERTEAVNELLVAAGSALGKKRGTNVVAPHRYVIRGNKGEKISMEEATWAEYFAALSRMVKDRKLPPSWKEHLYEHIHQLATMATVWDWPTCRQWSEAVFTMISDGRLPSGWEDKYAIKDVQRDSCLLGTRASVKQVSKQGVAESNIRQNEYSAGSSAGGRQKDFIRREYNKDSDGAPCRQWNWGNDCGFATSHGMQPERRCHLCAWCALKYGKANVHPEKACQNKRRFLDKKSGGDESRQGFQ